MKNYLYFVIIFLLVGGIGDILQKMRRKKNPHARSVGVFEHEKKKMTKSAIMLEDCKRKCVACRQRLMYLIEIEAYHL